MGKSLRYIAAFLIILLLSGCSISYTQTEDFDAEQSENVTIEESISTQIEEKTIEHIKPYSYAEIIFVGDIMLHMPQVNSAKTSEGYDFNPVFKYIKPYIEDSDLAIANIETSFSNKDKPFSGFPLFNSPVEILDALKFTGFNVLSTANNHVLDQGRDGIIKMIDELEKREIEYIGTSKGEYTPYKILDVNDIRVGIFTYAFYLNGLNSRLNEEEISTMLNLYDEDRAKIDIENAKKDGAEIIILFLHWGNEYQKLASDYQRDTALKLAEFGADIIVGSHPHVIQDSEIIDLGDRNTYVFYSLGNFYSNQRQETMGNSLTEDGAILKFRLKKDNFSGSTLVENINITPTWVYRKMENGKYGYYILPVKDALEGNLDLNLPENIIERLQRSYENTFTKLNLYKN
ncbi:MAG: CapA family protein [Tissierellales bacterium]|nr:CapA family protein [Tissierellales bacterium]